MTYDDAARKLAFKTIGTVETGLDYTAINPTDPITIGVMQWFGSRAASLLSRMTGLPEWDSVATSLTNDIGAHPSTESFWATRMLTAGEASSLTPLLDASHSIQVSQAFADFETYKDVAVTEGMDPDADTDAMLMFFTAYHQGGTFANEALEAATGYPHPTLADLRDAILAHPVFDDYPVRYNDAYDLITAGDITGIPDPDGGSAPPTTGGGNGGAGTTSTVRYLDFRGDAAIVFFRDGQRQLFYPNGRGQFIPRGGDTVTEPPDPTGPPPVGTDWVHPLPSGVLTSGFGSRPLDGYHWGADFSTPGFAGTIYAPTDLVITVSSETGAGSFNGSAGVCVKGHTLDGLYTFAFYHMQYGSRAVAVGDTVTKGSKIGIEGATGNVTGRHLHFEVYDGNAANPWPPPFNPTGIVPIDPVPLLEANGVNIV